MSQQSDTADCIFEDLSKAPYPLAFLVSDIRAKWGPEFSVPCVHNFIREVATLLIFLDGVEVGDLQEGRFVPWQIDTEEADEKISDELMEMIDFLTDETRYVFRRKMPN